MPTALSRDDRKDRRAPVGARKQLDAGLVETISADEVRSRVVGSSTITTTVETVTPEMARQLLERNSVNRPLRGVLAAHYAADMTAGRWEYNGQDIIIADDGELLDGQHRLSAIILAAIPVRMGIKRGLPRQVFGTLDAGAARSAGDVLALLGYQNYNATAAAGRVALLFESGRTLSDRASRKELTDYVVANPYMSDAVKLAEHSRGPLNTGPVGAVIFLGNRMRRFDGDLEEFLTGLHSGANLEAGDPRLTLRNWGANERMRNRGQIATRMCFAATARAWTAYVRGETLLQIKILRQPTRDTVVIAGFNS